MFYEAIFQLSKKMNYTTEAKRLAGKKIALPKYELIFDDEMLEQMHYEPFE